MYKISRTINGIDNKGIPLCNGCVDIFFLSDKMRLWLERKQLFPQSCLYGFVISRDKIIAPAAFHLYTCARMIGMQHQCAAFPHNMLYLFQ